MRITHTRNVSVTAHRPCSAKHCMRQWFFITWVDSLKSMGFHSNTLYCYMFTLYLMQVKHAFSNKLNFSLVCDKIISERRQKNLRIIQTHNNCQRNKCFLLLKAYCCGMKGLGFFSFFVFYMFSYSLFY